MRQIEWLDFMSVGDAVWDDGRREMLATLNRLADAGQARDPETARQVADALLAAAERHFAVEEADMLAAGYPQAPWHQRRHQQLLTCLRNWGDRLRDDWRVGQGANMFLSLAPALFRHYGDDDRCFARFRAGAPLCWRIAA